MTADGDHPGLLACGVYAAMQKNKELREEVMKLQHNLDEATRLMSIMDSKLKILQELQDASK